MNAGRAISTIAATKNLGPGLSIALALGLMLAVPVQASAQDRLATASGAPSEFRITNLQATAASVPFRVGTGEDASYIDTGLITIRGTAQGSFDQARRRARVTWNVTASAPGLQAQGIGPLRLTFVGTAVYDPERNELLVVDVSGLGGGTAQAPSCTQCVQNINYIKSQKKEGEDAVDWGRGIGGPVEFRPLSPADLDRDPVAQLLNEAARAAGLGLSRQDMDIVLRQYRQEPTKEMVVYYPETREAFSFGLQGTATVEFGPGRGR